MPECYPAKAAGSGEGIGSFKKSFPDSHKAGLVVDASVMSSNVQHVLSALVAGCWLNET